MPKRYIAQIDNVFFLAHIGYTLRLATSDIARETLPDDIQLLLRRLDWLEQLELARQVPLDIPPRGH